MGIARQQLLLFILCLATILLALVLGAGMIHNAYELREARRLEAHSNEVNEAIRRANQLFADADLRGRLELVGMTNGRSKEDLREETHKAVGVVRQLVSDNEAQVANVEELRMSLAARFRIQDETAGKAERENGSVTIPLEQNLITIQALHRVEKAFNNLESQENVLLRFRHADFNSKETRFNNLFIAFWGLFLTSFFLLVFFAYRALKRGGKTQTRIEEMKKAGGISDANAEELVQLIQEGQTWKTHTSLLW